VTKPQPAQTKDKLNIAELKLEEDAKQAEIDEFDR
jgi:hypothetical protein